MTKYLKVNIRVMIKVDLLEQPGDSFVIKSCFSLMWDVTHGMNPGRELQGDEISLPRGGGSQSLQGFRDHPGLQWMTSGAA